MRLGVNQEAFFALVRAGLWEKEALLLTFEKIDFRDVYRIAEEQSVIGLVAAGIDHIKDHIILQDNVAPFVDHVLQLEQRNQMMNHYIRVLVEQMRKAGINPLLVKGQGVAQCYNKPLWRSCGDIDFLLDKTNYQKAKELLIPLADEVETEYTNFKHQGITLGGWVVELHGTLHSRLSRMIDLEIDRIQEDAFRYGEVRVWRDEDMDVLLPAPDNDVLFLFTHILHHFFIEGVGLRQICDWCMFLWTYRYSLDLPLLEKRLKKMGIISEWRAFATLAVEWLGIPEDAMPLYSSDSKWQRKADNIVTFVLESGNFGQNRPMAPSNCFIVRKLRSRWFKIRNFVGHLKIFPWDSVIFFLYFLANGIQVATNNRE